jgi:predicted nucleic acid-binding Zn ribbon protein
MAQASRQHTRQIGNLALLVAAPRPPASPLSDCLGDLQRCWQQGGHLAALWQAWPRACGPQLAPHCRPLRLQGGLLTVGAAPGPWLQALQYNRHQLLAALRVAGFTLRDLRIEQARPLTDAGADGAAVQQAWNCHPSRADVHGMATCPACGSPAPAGEMARWGHCSFCRRQSLQAAAADPDSAQ